LFVLTSVLLSCWLYRLVRTSQQARPGLVGYSCGWAAGSWFIPVVNMVWPIRVIVDVWRKSGTGPEPDPLPRMITAWWTVLVAAELVVASAIAFGAGDSDAQVERHDHLASIGGILFAIAALLGVVAVRAVAERVRTLARAATAAQDAVRFNPPPGWPQPPRGWRPVPGWQPDPAWPPAPPSWTFWIPSAD
ncbi:MAG: DUF4328 domain-containing protein, partial [Frankiaceae bacterium]|nr:DUF4328 domain-containing protein [Frankiaceae bacterium]